MVLPGYLPASSLIPALQELPLEFPTAEDFHDHIDPVRNERFRDEFAGITNFPFTSIELSLLAVHPDLLALAEDLLESNALRVYSIEAWAKYTGAADYEQSHHRDYLNHSLVVPAPGSPSQVEMFLYLSDVLPELGPPSFVPAVLATGLAALPNWYPKTDGGRDDEHPDWISPRGRPDLYDHEVPAVGPAGTVVAYRIETFHRATALTAPRGARYTIHVNFRIADRDWITRRGWTDAANQPVWQRFVSRAAPRQLIAFGFPRPAIATGPQRRLQASRSATPDWILGPGAPSAPTFETPTSRTLPDRSPRATNAYDVPAAVIPGPA